MAAGRISFGEWAERWYLATAHLKPSTRRDYRMLLDHQVLLVFGDWSLGSIDNLAVKECGLACSLTVYRLSVPARRFRCFLRFSARLLRVGGSLVTPPLASSLRRFSVRRCISWTRNRSSGLASVAEGRYRPLILFAAYTGLRPCELVALRVGRLDLLRCTARVVEAAVEVSRLEWGPVKTHEARVVRMPRSVAEEVAGSLAGRPQNRDALVFTAPPWVGR